MSEYGEPWAWAIFHELGNLPSITECHGEVLADVCDEDYARRIVACVNACLGLSNTVLEAMGLDAAVFYDKQQRATVDNRLTKAERLLHRWLSYPITEAQRGGCLCSACTVNRDTSAFLETAR
jgi:hypothetical protein